MNTEICLWKFHSWDQEYYCDCNNIFKDPYGLLNNYYYFMYCPYCGRKIEVEKS